MKNLSLIVSFFLLTTTTEVFSSGFLYHSDGPYKGKVIDQETGQPIEGVVVAGVWELRLLYVRLSDPLPRFCDAKEALTDKSGEFLLPKASCFTFWPIAELAVPEVVVFKPGYLAYPPLGATYEERKAQMPGFQGDEFQDKKQYTTIKLGKPKTRAEKEFTYDHAGTPFNHSECFKKLPVLLKLSNEERKNLGFSGKEGN